MRYNNKRNRDDCKTWVRHYSSVRNVEEVDEQDGSTHIVGGERGDMVSANRKFVYAKVRRDLFAIVSGAQSYRMGNEVLSDMTHV